MYFEKRKSKKAKSGYTWCVKFYYTDEYGSKRRYSKSGFDTKAAAERHGRDILRQVEKFGSMPRTVTLSRIYEEWSALKMNSLAPNTRHGYSSVWKNHIAPAFGQMDIKAISYSRLQAFFNELSGSAGIVKALFQNLFKFAIRTGYAEQNPVSLVEIRTKEKAPAQDGADTISLEDLENLIDQLQNSRTRPERKKALILFLWIGFYTGLRCSEICALEAQDFDLDARTVSITKQIGNDGQSVTERLKTASSRAVLPAAAPLLDLLRPILSQMDPTELIVSDDGFTPIRPNNVRISLKHQASKIGLEFHPHMLRHSFITNLVRSGVDPKTAAKLARHSDISMTMNVYTNMNQADLSAAISRTFSEKSHEKDPKTIYQ